MTHHHLLREARPAVLVCLLVAIAAFAGCLGGGDDDPAPAGTDANDQNDDAGTLPGDGDDEGMDGADGNMSGDEDEPGAGDEGTGEDPTACVPTLDSIHASTHDGLATPDPTAWDPASADPTTLVAQTGMTTFSVAEDVTALMVTLVQAGVQVTPGWSVTITDPTGSEAYSYSQAADANPEGAADDSTTITGPAAGEWTVTLMVAGYVEGIALGVDAETCV